MEEGIGPIPLSSGKTFQVSPTWGSHTAASCPTWKQQPFSELLRPRKQPPQGHGEPTAWPAWFMDPSLVSSADERFDATFHTNVLVNSSGHCQYLPPGKYHSLCSLHLDSVREVGVPYGAPRGSS